MTLRDDLVPVIDDLRGMIGDLGLRRYIVQTVRRTFSGAEVGRSLVGYPPIDVTTTITPAPKVADDPLRFVASPGGESKDGAKVVKGISVATYTRAALDGGEVAANEEWFWLLNGEKYAVEGVPEERNFGWTVRLRRMNR